MAKISINQMKEKAVDFAQSGLAKSSQVAEMSKLQLNIASHEEIIKKSFFEIGKRYYEMNGENPDPAFEAACQKANMSFTHINKNKERIKELRNPDASSIYDITNDVIELNESDLFDNEEFLQETNDLDGTTPSEE